MFGALVQGPEQETGDARNRSKAEIETRLICILPLHIRKARLQKYGTSSAPM